jgi:glycosyltransferase involved in cell wall biosynthesis
MKSQLVSIIIPIYNRAHLVGETLESIQRQTYPHWECILVDDGSSDNTCAKVREYTQQDLRIKLMERPSQLSKGPNSCRNYGFENSKGELIYFLDSDDVVLEGALEVYQSNFHKDTQVVIAPIIKINADGTEESINTIGSNNLIEDYFTGAVSFYVCGPMWRRSFLELQPELFDESLRNLDDWDFNLRMWYAQPNAVFLEDPTVRYLQHDHSLKKELAKGNTKEIESAFRARFKHLALLNVQDPANKQKYQRHIAQFYKKTLRNALQLKQPWWNYYRSMTRLLWQTRDYKLLVKVSFGVVVYLVFGKGYRFFE